MPPKEKYSDPGLRDKVKEEVHKSDKGGAPGQWSARKAQLMASEYKKKGGGYNTDKETGQDDSQKNLTNWGKEDWQTKEGSGQAKKEDGTRKRYLPKKAWEEMTEKEKNETEAAKEEGSKGGQQFVGNTEKAKKSRKKVAEGGEDNKEEEKEAPKAKRAKKEEPAKETKSAKDKKPAKEDKAAKEKAEGSRQTRSKGEVSKAETTDKSAEKNKKARPSQEHGEKGSKDRLPKKGQAVHWKAMPGMVKGEVLEILTSETTVEGKKIKATKENPQVKLKSHGPSGKTAVHKIDNVFF